MANILLTPFPCTSCGLCCRRVSDSLETQVLDRGDGVCHFLNEKTNLCDIYEQRPLVCRVQEYYIENYRHKISWKKFVDINVQICFKLQDENLVTDLKQMGTISKR